MGWSREKYKVGILDKKSFLTSAEKVQKNQEQGGAYSLDTA